MQAGLEISEEKTKYLVVSKSLRTQHVGQNLTIGSYNFEGVQQFKYLGSTLTGENDATSEVKQRIASGSGCLFGLHSVFRSKWITANTKKTIYRTVLRPVIT